MTDAILQPGTTCWRLARAGRLAVIVDAAAYFAEVKKAILQARHSVLLIGWDFDTRIELEQETPDPTVPNRLGHFLNHVVRRNRSLRVHVLRWDLSTLKRPLDGLIPLRLMDWLTSPRLHLRLDGHHPAESCHHQKIAVIDDAIAFCGGIDITSDRWDTPEHRDEDPRRVRPDGTWYGPWHDVTTVVDGEAARALGELARRRWHAATGERLSAPAPGQVRWPDHLEPVFRDVDVAIARTRPAYDGRHEVREIEALYLAAIAAARRTIYLESQYFSTGTIAAALRRRLEESDGPEIVVVNPRAAEGWLEEAVMGPARALLLGRLRAADRHGRLRFCTPVTEGGTDIYVHAKVLVVDDTLLRVGSSNINNRSLGVDTECDLAVEARGGDPGAEAVRRAILEVRDSLLAEHLGVTRAELDRTLRRNDGSLVRTLDQLMRPEGRTLVPFEPPSFSEAERALAESHVLDPRRPEGIVRTAVRTMRILAPPPGRVLAGAAGLAAVLGVAGLGIARLIRRARAGRRDPVPPPTRIR